MASLGTAYVNVKPDMTALTGRSFGSRMARVGKVAGAALAGAFVLETKAAVTTTQDLTKSTIGLHKNLGLTNKVASEWAGVAKARGADTTKLGMAFKTLASQISAAGDGSAASVAMFKELGFSQKDIQRSLTDTQFAVKGVADGLQNLPAGADKATFSAKLFGRGWATIAPVLRDGSAAMQEQLDTVEKYGGVLEGKTLKQQETLLANIRENKIAWQGFQVTLATAVTPVLNDVSDQFQQIAATMANPKLTDDEKFKRVAKLIQQDFSKALDVIVDLIPQIASNVGQQAPKIAIGLVQGFLHANIWGQLALGAWFIKKAGLGGALMRALGQKLGLQVGTSVATGAASGEAVGAAATAGTALGTAIGTAAAVAAIAIIGKQVSDFLDNLAPTGKQHFGSEPGLPGKQGGPGQEHIGLVPIPFTGGDSSSGGTMSQRRQRAVLAPDKSMFDQLDFLIGNLRASFGSLSKAADAMSQHQREAWITAAKAAHRNGDLSDKATKRVIGVLKDASAQQDDTADKTKKAQEQISKSVSKSSDSVKKNLSNAADVGTKQGQKLNTNVGGSVLSLAITTMAGMANIRDNTASALKALGVKQAFNFVLKSLKKATGLKEGGVVKAAKGAVVKGSGNDDTVPLHIGGELAAMVQPGELVSVANRPTTNTLMAMNDRLRGLVPRLAKGGALGPYRYPAAVSPMSMTLDRGIDVGGTPIFAIGDSSAVNTAGPDWLGQGPGLVYKLAAGAPKGYSPSSPYIYITEAFSKAPNIGGGFKAGQRLGYASASFPNIEMGWASSMAGGTLADALGEPFEHRHDNPAPPGGGLAAGRSFWAFLNDLYQGHRVAGGGAAGGGPQWKNIARQILQGPKGPLRDAGQAALDKVWKAANAYGRKRAGATGGTTGFIPGGSGSVLRQMNTVLKRAGFKSHTAIPAIMGNAFGESSWDPTLAHGLFGFLSGDKSAEALAAYAAKQKQPRNSATTQTNFMLTTMTADLKARMNSESMNAGVIDFLNNWEIAPGQGIPNRLSGAAQARSMGYKLGGLIPWFGNGGQITASRPTLLGIGDKGTETATVTKGAPGRPVVHVHLHGPGMDELVGRVSVEIEEDGAHHRHLSRMG